MAKHEGERMKLSEMPTLELIGVLRATERTAGPASVEACILGREVHRRVEVNEWAQGWEKRIAAFEERVRAATRRRTHGVA